MKPVVPVLLALAVACDPVAGHFGPDVPIDDTGDPEPLVLAPGAWAVHVEGASLTGACAGLDAGDLAPTELEAEVFLLDSAGLVIVLDELDLRGHHGDGWFEAEGYEGSPAGSEPGEGGAVSAAPPADRWGIGVEMDGSFDVPDETAGGVTMRWRYPDMDCVADLSWRAERVGAVRDEAEEAAPSGLGAAH